MSSTMRTVVMMVIAGLTAGCGGGLSDAPAPQIPGRISGVLFGTVTRAGQTFQAFALVNGGRFMAVDGGNVFYDGTFSASGGQIASSALRVYANDPTGRAFIRSISDATATLQASVTTAGWIGTIDSTLGQIKLDLGYELELDGQDSSLTFIDNEWLYQNQSGTYDSLLAIEPDGTTATTNSDNCNSAGKVSIIDPKFGVYGWQTTLSGATCGNLDDQPYTGFGLLSDSADPLDTLTIYLANANYFLSHRSYRRQP